MIQKRHSAMGGCKPTIYLPVEVKARELKAKVLIAQVAAHHGFRTYLGTKRAIDLLIERKPTKGGIYFYKGGKPAATLERIKRRVERFVVLDEEMGPAVQELNRYYQGRIYPGTENLIDRMFLVGQTHLEALSRVRPELAKCAVVTGWPRIDLWRPEMKSQYEAEVAEIQRRFGDYLLFSSDFGITSNKVIEVERARLDEVDFNEATRSHFLMQMDAAFRDFCDFTELVLQLDADPGFPKLVIRPHPSEDIAAWHARLPGLKKTQVLFEGEISPWLYASKGLIHRGCTTAVQAYYAKIPAVYLASRHCSPKRETLPFLTSHFAETPDELKKIANAMFAGDVSVRETDAAAPHICSTATLATDKIVDILGSLNVSPEPPYAESRLKSLFGALKGRLIEFKVEHGVGGGKDRLARVRRKTGGGIHAPEVRRILNQLNPALSDIQVTEKLFNLNQIEMP